MAKSDSKSNSEVSGWVGWIGFASVMLYLAGLFHVIAGIAALLNDKVYVLTPQAQWSFDITQWGWIHIIGGILAIFAAASLMQGKGYSRTIAIIVALLSAAANMSFIPVYPIWSLLIIAVDVLVIYSVVVHGSELKD